MIFRRLLTLLPITVRHILSVYSELQLRVQDSTDRPSQWSVDVFATASDLDSSNERDRIYALLSLLPMSVRNAIKLDYTADVDKVWITSALSIMQTLSSTELLRMSCNEDSEFRLSSWCPRFDQPWHDRRDTEEWDASAGVPCMIKQHPSNAISVRSCFIHEIRGNLYWSYACPIANYESTLDSVNTTSSITSLLKSWRSFAASSLRDSDVDCDFSVLFWRTVARDTTVEYSDLGTIPQVGCPKGKKARRLAGHYDT